jgi:hypothetical protein
MPRNSESPPVEVKIGKVRNIRPYDSTVAKAVAEAAGEVLDALFQSGSRRRTFRIVTGTPAEGGLLVDGAIHELTLGEPRENAAMLTFTVVLEATTTRRRSVQSASVDGHASIDTASNPVPQAIRIMQDTLRRGAERFVDGCEREVTRNR